MASRPLNGLAPARSLSGDPPGDGVLASSDFPAKRPDVYEFALDLGRVTGRRMGPGEVIDYRAAGKSYVSTLMEGLAIGGAAQPTARACDKPLAAIQSAFGSS
jgi:hypothetical protein